MYELERESGDVECNWVRVIGVFIEGKLRKIEENNQFIEVVEEEVSVKLLHECKINAIENT